MTRAIVYDRCIDAARATCARLRKSRMYAIAVHPTDFDRTFDAEGVPHVIVTELEMPLFSGFELIRQIRSEWSASEMPIVAYTSLDDRLAWNKAREIGANELVSKSGDEPFKQLEAAIARCLHRPEPRPPASQPRGYRIFSRIFARPALAAA